MPRSGLLLVSVLALAGCGGTSAEPPPTTPPPGIVDARTLASYAARTTAIPSMKVDGSITLVGTLAKLLLLRMPITGGLDNKAQRMEVSVDMSRWAVFAGKGAPAAVTNPKNWKGAVIGNFSDGQAIEFIDLPVLSAALEGVKWIMVDLDVD